MPRREKIKARPARGAECGPCAPTPKGVADTIISHIPAALAVFSSDGLLLWASDDLWALVESETSAEPSPDALSPMIVPRLLSCCGESLDGVLERIDRSGEPLQWDEVPFPPGAKNGRHYDVKLVRLAPEGSPLGGGLGHYLLMLTDVTARVRSHLRVKELEESARRVEILTRLGEVVGSLAHEINDPMCIISGNAQYLNAALNACSLSTIGPIEWQDALDCLGSIEKESHHCSSLVTSLVALTRQMDDTRQVREPINVNLLLERALRIYESGLAAAGVRIVRCLADPSPVAQGDPWQVRQAILNLLHRAWKAMRCGGALQVVTRAVPDGVVVELNGTSPCGHAKDAQVVADTAGTSRTTRRAGDLALSIARLLVAQNCGTIEIEEDPRLDTAVSVTLPANAGAAD